MKKKLILLMSVVFVLGLVLTSQTKAADPAASLIGYWKLDGDTLDSSGFDNHGTTVGNPVFVAGKYNGAIHLDGSGDYLVIDSVADDFTSDDLTLSAWIKTDDPGTWQWWFSGNTGDTSVNGNVIILGLISGEIVVYENGEEIHSQTLVNDLQWHHVAYSRIGGIGSLYINGVLEGTHDASFNLSADDRWSIGQEFDGASPGDFLDGTVDDVRIYDRGLTAEELPLIMTTLPPGAASEPSPENQATDVPRDVVLSWTPGKFVPALNGHKLYLSESFDDVNDGVGGVTLSSNSYAPPQRLDFETVYYWRVDEVNAPPDSTVFPGKVWSFTTEPFGYPIDGANITATASSQAGVDVGPEKTIDGSGLDENDLHSTVPTDMWLSDSEPSGAWIQYEFDSLCKLHQMWVWNSNQVFENMFLGFGLRNVTVEYSTDGTNWMTLADVPEFTRAPGADGYAHDTTVDFGGVVAKFVRLTATSNWSDVLPQFGLSEVRFFYIPLLPREPYPAQGAVDIPVDVTLSWRAGRESSEHEVSFSTDEQAVIDGTAPVTTVTEAAYGPLSLDLGQTYYWQIVEVNNVETPAKWQGNVWGFTTEKYIVVDDFELYNDIPADEPDSDLVYMTWIDGFDNPNINGSIMGYVAGASMEVDNVHGGSKSVPMEYNNTTAPVSEVTANLADLPVGSDWTKHSIRTLSLWFSGAAGNTGGQLYVKINGSKVVYDGEPANLQKGWQVWNIELSSFDVDLQNVTTISIGVEGANATGTLLLDDIRLYPYGRELVTPTEPGTADLIGYWKLDGDALDSSGRGNDGTLVGDATYETGKTGQAMKLDGFEDYLVIDPVADDITDNDIALSAWVKTADTGSVYWFSCNTVNGGNVALLGILGGRFAIYDINIAEGHSRMLVNDLEWHHLAYTRIGDIGSLYVDGVLEGTHTANFNYSVDDLWSIGQEWDAGPTASNFLTGSVDDARIYDAGLSYAEIAALAGRTMPFDKPFED